MLYVPQNVSPALSINPSKAFVISSYSSHQLLPGNRKIQTPRRFDHVFFSKYLRKSKYISQYFENRCFYLQPFRMQSLLKYALREFDLFCCKSRLWLPFLLNRFKRFTHFTWLVVFFWSHFLFQWFWFLSIIEVSKVFLRTTSMTINKWVQKDRKGSRLKDKLPITTIREKSLKKVL